MADFIINVFIYTFAIFGVITFFNEMINSMGRRRNLNKIILLVEKDNETVEMELKEILCAFKNKNMDYLVYILDNGKNTEVTSIIENLCKENEFCIRVQKDEVLNILEQ